MSKYLVPTDVNDIPAIDIEDSGMQLIRVYPYKLIKLKSDIATFKENTTSILLVSNANIRQDSNFTETQEDETGKIYFEMFCEEILDGKIDITSQTLNFGTKLQYERSINGYTNHFHDKEYDELLIYFIGEPYSKTRFETGQQECFLSSTVALSNTEREEIFSQYNQFDSFPTRMEFVNIKVLESQFQNSGLAIIETDEADLSFSSDKPIEMVLHNNSLLGSVEVGVLDGNNIKKVNVRTDDKLIPVVATPAELNDSLYMYFRWFDNKQTLPLFVVNKFKTSNSLSEIFKGDSGTWLVDGEKCYGTLVNMIAMSYMYLSDFNSISDSDKISDESSSAYGQPKNSIRIGSETWTLNGDLIDTTGQSKVVNTIINKNPRSIVQTCYETLLQNNPQIDGDTLSLLQAAIAALSRNIISEKFSVGGGAGALHESYLPWYLEIQGAIPVSNNTNNYSIQSDINVLLKSKWFDVSAQDIVPYSIPDLSEPKLIRGEVNNTIPLIPPQLTPMNISTDPAGINETDSNPLAYKWYIPSTDSSFLNTVYFDNPTETTGAAKAISLNNIPITDTQIFKDNLDYTTLQSMRDFWNNRELLTEYTRIEYLAARQPFHLIKVLSEFLRDYIQDMDFTTFNGLTQEQLENIKYNYFRIRTENAKWWPYESLFFSADYLLNKETDNFKKFYFDWVNAADQKALLFALIDTVSELLSTQQDTILTNNGQPFIGNRKYHPGNTFGSYSDYVFDNFPPSNSSALLASWKGKISDNHYKYFTQEKLTELNTLIYDKAILDNVYISISAVKRERALVTSLKGMERFLATADLPFDYTANADILGFLIEILKGYDSADPSTEPLRQFFEKLYRDDNISGSHPEVMNYLPALQALWPTLDIKSGQINSIFVNGSGESWSRWEWTFENITRDIPSFTQSASFSLKPGTTTSISVNNRKILFNSHEWHHKIRSWDSIVLNTTNITLKPISDYSYDRVEYIYVTSLWEERIRLKIGELYVDIPSINQIDDTLTKQGILFI